MHPQASVEHKLHHNLIAQHPCKLMAGVLGVRPAAIHGLMKLEQLLAGQRLWCASFGYFDAAQLFGRVAATRLLRNIHTKCAQSRQRSVDAGGPHLGLDKLVAIQPQIGWGDQAATQRRAIGLLEPRSEPRYGADIGANRVSGEIVLARPLLSSTTKDLAKLLKEVQTGLPEEVEIAGVISDGQQPIRKAVKQVLPEVRHQLCQFHYLREAAQPIYEADRHAKKELKKLVRGPTASD